MNNREKAKSLVKQGHEALKREIESHASGTGTIANVPQLIAFQMNFDEMLRQLESGNIPEKGVRGFGIGHIIVDSWPLDSKLGSLLCSAEQAYKNL